MVDVTFGRVRGPTTVEPHIAEALRQAINPEYVDESFTIEKWLREDGAWLYYSEDLKDFAMFEKLPNGWYEGHQWLTSRKGRAGITFCSAVIEDFFESSDAEGILGLPPVENRPAQWMARRLGFTSGDAFVTPAGWVRLFFLTSPSNSDIIVE